MARSSDILLTTPIGNISGVGPVRVKALLELGVRNVGQLIAHLPMRHERLEAESAINELSRGTIVTTRGEVTATRITQRGRRPRFQAVLMDHSGRLDLTWFNALYLRHKITPGVSIRVQGKAQLMGSTGGLQLTNPKFWMLKPDGALGESGGGDEAKAGSRGEEITPQEERLRPIYPASGLITTGQIEGIVQNVLGPALAHIDDHFPADFRTAHDLPELRVAYRMMHAPQDEAEVLIARRRLAYDELFMLQLGMALRRAELRRRCAAPELSCTKAIDSHIRARFPFTLTKDQDTVVRELAKDLSSSMPASRLIQGDVGSGKTAVALYAMLLAVAGKHQAAMMAPTELLAEQHFASIGRMLGGSKVRMALLSGSLPVVERAAIRERLAKGEIDLVVGTHALLTDGVEFKSLAVAVIDEQHRFGVHQRAALRTRGGPKGKPDKDGKVPVPHMLVMTATPIPRTLALTLMGDLDVSVIKHLPPGRKPIVTKLVGPEVLTEVWAFVAKRVAAGEQAYVVAPSIDAGGKNAELFDEGAEPRTGATKLASVREIAALLKAGPTSGLRVATMHGRLDTSERERVMDRFRKREIDVLVATTVIEVGVDVPNATVMVIMDADRFGLAQLHQLRGRVGRGGASSACILVAPPTAPITAQQRLLAFSTTTDGFELAEKDLEIRGFGQMIGLSQSGVPPFKIANLVKDQDLLQMARRDAAAWIAASPELGTARDALLKRRLLKQHGLWLGVADVG